MKKISLSTILTVGVLIFFLYRQVPLMMENIESEGTSLKTMEYALISSKEETIKFPPQDKKVIAIFWASWCGPCKIEMARLKASVDAGKISKDAIFAINPFENKMKALTFLSKNNYPFQFIDAPDVAKQLKVKATPTTLLLDNGRITSRSSGMSLFGIWRAELFL